MDVGAKLLAALIAEGDILLYRKMALSEKMFFGEESSLFGFVDSHVQKYNVLPKMATVAEQFPEMPTPSEPLGFYRDKVETRFTHKVLHRALSECNEYMKGQDTFTAQATLIEAITEIRSTQARTSMAEFTQQAHDLYMGQYHKHQTKVDLDVFLGWPMLDLNGGLGPGDVLSVIGRPAMGKTFSLLYNAMYATTKQKLKTLVISMEMPMMEIIERLVAMYTHFPMSHIQTYGLTTAQQKKLPPLLKKAKDEEGKLWILDANFASTVNDIFALVYQLNPHALYIDGAYLLQHEDKRMNRYQRAEANMELVKRRATEFGIPVVQSYQFNRDAIKKQKKSKGKDKGGLEDIAYSDTIGQVSSIVLGMYEEESVETMIAREIHVLKGRKGQTGKFKINWLFDKMDFTQILSDEQKEKGNLEFV